jgi:hypothetical protein
MHAIRRFWMEGSIYDPTKPVADRVSEGLRKAGMPVE